MIKFHRFLIFLIIFSIGIGFGHSYFKTAVKTESVKIEKNTPEAFISEVYDKIKENYWDNISDSQLLELYKLSFEKNQGGIVTKFESKDKMIKAVLIATKSMDEEKKNKFISQLVGTVIASLSPNNRSGLFTEKQEVQLKNTVENIDPQKDLYKDLGVGKQASSEAIQQAFQKKSDQIAKEGSAGAQEKLKNLSYAKEVLTQKDSKVLYDQKGVEPTIFTKIIQPDILYFLFKKFSPTSYDEFLKAFDAYKDSAVSTLIFDLRGNVGGQIDSTVYYLGNFIGKNQLAFDFYHKNDYIPFKTPTEKLSSISKYKQIVMLVDNQTQSSAEIIASSFKKYHIGVVIGTPTKGWGTVERVFPIDNQFDPKNKYSLFLVHSITLRDDNQPIEGRGVDPDINIKTPNWESELFSYFRNQALIEAVKSL